MEQVTNFLRYIDFTDANNALIESNPLQYFFLREMFEKVVKREQELIKLFNISNGSNKIIVLFTMQVCLIYDDGYDETLIPLLSKELEFEKFKRFQFAGSKRTIDKLFELNNASYEMQKHRVTYKCSAVSDPFTPAPGRMEMGNINRLDELVSLSRGFAKAYYGENKSFNDAAAIILSGIQKDSIYQWVDNGRVCAVAQSMHEEYDFPVIGHFYTNPLDRNKGYGTSIIHGLTNGLLKDGGHQFVMLQTNALTPQSNRIFEKVGYQNIGEYLLAYKSK
jgi:hypothetical protein